MSTSRRDFFKIAGAVVRVRAHLGQLATDHKGRITTAVLQDRRDHRGRGGLAVRTGDRDGLPTGHGRRERLRPVDDPQATGPGLDQLDGSDGKRGWVDLTISKEFVETGSGLAIIGHPEGGPLKLSLNTQSVIGYDQESKHLMYRTDTLAGCSGAPGSHGAASGDC